MRRVFNRTTRVTRVAPIEDALSLSLSLLFSRINRARDFVNKREESARILLFFAFFPPESTQGKIFGECLGFSYFRIFGLPKSSKRRVLLHKNRERERERTARFLSFSLSFFHTLCVSVSFFARERASSEVFCVSKRLSRVFMYRKYATKVTLPFWKRTQTNE